MDSLRLEAVSLVYIQSLIATVLAISGLSKAIHRHTFAFVVSRYRLLSISQSAALARVLPEAEIAIALLLCVPATMAIGAIASGVLFATFGAAIGVNLARGNTNIACGCFGGADEGTIRRGDVLRNVVLCAMALYLTRLLANGPVTDVSWSERIAGTLVATTTILCYWLGKIAAGGRKLNESLAR